MINVCIVDDEKNIREGIRMLIDWETLGCQITGLCASGLAALQFIRENPVDIVVTDIKMPTMDGLDLSRKLKDEFEDIRVIILTAYSEFSMARDALRYGVSDFIVKNDFMEELPPAIEKNVKYICENRAQKERLDSLALTGKVDGFEGLIEMVTGNPNRAVRIDEQTLNRYSDRYYIICACEINSYEDSRGEDHNPVDMFKNLLKISLKNCEYTVCEFSDRLIFLGINYEKSGGIDIHRIVGYLDNMLIMVEEFMRVQIKIGISSQYEKLESMGEACAEAKDVLAKIDSNGCLLKVYDGNLHAINGELIDVDRYVEGICELTFDETKDDAVELLKSFAKELMESDCTFDQCRLYMLVVFSALIHKAVRYQLSVELDFNEYEKEVYKKVHRANTVWELAMLGEEIVGRLREICVGKQNFKNELVKKVDDCIREMYKEELTLQIISGEIYLNSSYVSRAYKKMTGKTVTEAITLYRVGKAKEMLTGTNKKIYEIAESVGFKDAAYFTNVFAKYENISPSDYRQSK